MALVFIVPKTAIIEMDLSIDFDRGISKRRSVKPYLAVVFLSINVILFEGVGMGEGIYDYIFFIYIYIYDFSFFYVSYARV